MKSGICFLCVLLCVSASLFAGPKSKPRLVVGVVLDQMRYDFLYRYAERYSAKGFKRLLREGHSCENTFINYLPTYTGPGHACIYTGSVPALHGISSNDWIDRVTGAKVYCTQDAGVQNIGGTLKAGRMSPKNLWASTIGDELRLSNQRRSKVVAISVKDRASILPGGHLASSCYWMDDTLGVFMSSTFYAKNLPEWVEKFNNQMLAKNYMSQPWQTLYPIETYVNSTSDDNIYEGKFVQETNPVFPHKLSHLKPADIKKTPFGNSILLDFAKASIEHENLGKGEFTDMLTISFSSTDYVGHMYGPNSIENEDTYLRMDALIGDLLDYLDEQVGSGQYTLFLTSDHGVAHNPQYLLDQKMHAGYLFAGTLKSDLNLRLKLKFNVDMIIRDISENFIWLNDSLLNATGLNRTQIIEQIQADLMYHEEIQFAVNMHDLSRIVLPEPLRQMAINGFVSRRSGDILLLLNPAWLDAYSKTGTTHGTWNPYDSHIPLVWYGWGIQKGQTFRTVHMTDIAATLATLLHIQMPNACIGHCIPEVIAE
jgi:predicted AlkP superfamily pyrophosphatase or phosphodiesterase